ncbi:MAG TPA: nuclear transport factor 2 family protein [Conexibacter sp.]|nr:nuclear transport factor 2 family protein [Conexibacter sp.]
MPPHAPDDVVQDERIVVRWIDAINDGDVDGALHCLDPAATFHPLRLGVDGAYQGHDGVRRWFERLERQQRRHRIELAELRRTEHADLLAAGRLSYPDEPGISPFCGMYRLAAGLIVMAHHYLSDADTVERILGPATRRS